MDIIIVLIIVLYFDEFYFSQVAHVRWTIRALGPRTTCTRIHQWQSWSKDMGFPVVCAHDNYPTCRHLVRSTSIGIHVLPRSTVCHVVRRHQKMLVYLCAAVFPNAIVRSHRLVSSERNFYCFYWLLTTGLAFMRCVRLILILLLFNLLVYNAHLIDIRFVCAHWFTRFITLSRLFTFWRPWCSAMSSLSDIRFRWMRRLTVISCRLTAIWPKWIHNPCWDRCYGFVTCESTRHRWPDGLQPGHNRLTKIHFPFDFISKRSLGEQMEV